MREYVFLLEYERGVHPIRDVFIDNPEVVVTALDISLSRDRGWRIERMTGPEQALDTVETAFFNEQCNDCTYPTHTCDAAAEYQVLEREPTTRTIYRHVPEMTYCHAVSYLALTTLGDGLVFDATQRGAYYEWRLLIPNDRDVDSFYRALQEDLPEGVSLELRRAGSADGWPQALQAGEEPNLPYEQREAVETARRLGYYEHQRDVTLEEIAEELEIPLTTLQYRLRRAEDWATETALSGYQIGKEYPNTTAGTDGRLSTVDIENME
jgi:hypothetical protein